MPATTEALITPQSRGKWLVSFCTLALALVIFAGGVVLFGPTFATWTKSAMGIVFSAAFLAFGMLMLRWIFREQGFSFGWILRAFAVAAIFLVVLTRGAPHNNPLLSVAFESSGAFAVAVLTAATIILAFVGAWLVLRRMNPVNPDDFCRQHFGHCIAILAFGAAVAAAAPILAAWDQPSWSDAVSYDSIAHGIALGELPFGRSDYMPVFQFGGGAFYWTFGHFFFVPQIVNLVLAPTTVILLAFGAAWLFGSAPAGIVAGLLASSHDYLRYTPNMMTIENWYLPAVALALYCAARFLATPSLGRVVLLALAAGLVFSIRVQGAFFCAFLVITPLFAGTLSYRTRLQYCLVAGFTFTAVLLPWTIRNLVHDGRLSPATTQSAGQMIYTTDSRPFYGIRREFGSHDIIREWAEKYPDPKERNAELALQGWLMPLTHPKLVWLEAVPWRFLAFYGLLPPGVWDAKGVRATDWRTEGLHYALQVGPVSMLLLATLVGLLLARPTSISLFLLGGIAANLAIIVFAGFSEPRVSYPVFPLHILLVAAPFAIKGRGPPWPSHAPENSRWKIAVFLILAAVAIVIAMVGRKSWGERYAYRPIVETTTIDAETRIDLSRPDITCAKPPVAEGSLQNGYRHSDKIVRIRAVLSNYHFPVKYYGLASDAPGTALRGFPAFTSDPKLETYFQSDIPNGACPGQVQTAGRIRLGIAFANATSSVVLREYDLVEIEGRLRAEKHNGRNHWMWIHAQKVRVIENAVRMNH